MAGKVEKKTDENTPNPYDQYTINALIEIILYQISSKKRHNKDNSRSRNPYWTVNGDDTLEWVNLKYAYQLSLVLKKVISLLAYK
jgi:hypothetical protein